MRCPSCLTDTPDHGRFCLACGTPLARPTATDTVAIAAPTHTASAPSIDEGRFPAGSVVAGRYRILGLLGRGGMGEVYRAHDLVLSQPVALKFLSEAGHASEAALARFRNEVRV